VIRGERRGLESFERKEKRVVHEEREKGAAPQNIYVWKSRRRPPPPPTTEQNSSFHHRVPFVLFQSFHLSVSLSRFLFSLPLSFFGGLASHFHFLVWVFFDREEER